MKKILITSVCVVLTGIVLTGVIIVGAYTSDKQKNELLYQAGQIDKSVSSGLSRSSADIAAQGKHITISALETDKIQQKNILTGIEEEYARELALNYLIKRESLYYTATQAGYAATAQEINSVITSQRTAAQNATNRSDFLSYLSGAGLTEDQYWQSQYDVFLKDIVISKYFDNLKNEYINENNITDTSTEKFATMWKNQMDTITQQAITAEEVTIL